MCVGGRKVRGDSGLHPYKRDRQTRQRGDDRWEETASDKGRTGWEDSYWQAAQSKVMRAFGHKPLHHIPGNRLSPDLHFSPFAFSKATSSLFLPPSDNYHLQRFPRNKAIIPASVKWVGEDGQTLCCTPLCELVFKFVMACCQPWQWVALNGATHHTLSLAVCVKWCWPVGLSSADWSEEAGLQAHLVS